MYMKPVILTTLMLTLSSALSDEQKLNYAQQT